MKEIAVVSGKGGTGKTSITASFAALSESSVIADCDVDASDMHLVTSPQVVEKTTFRSGFEAVIDAEKCVDCGRCAEACRFDSVFKSSDAETFYVNHTFCEGCGVCSLVCPAEAVKLVDRICGEWYVSDTRFGQMVHAELGAAGENSGRLVGTVRNKAREIADMSDKDLVIIDGPPGIGCPVIATVTGTDALICVTEPTISGLEDLKRLIQLGKHFDTRIYIVVNKWDINPEITRLIEAYGDSVGAEVLGRVPWDGAVTDAQENKQAVVEFRTSGAAKEIKSIWEKLCQKIL